MPSLLIRDLPDLVDQKKDHAPTSTMMYGTAEAQLSLVRSLLRHGTYEKYYFLSRPGETIERTWERLRQYPAAERAEPIALREIGRLADQQLIMLATEPRVHEWSSARQWAGLRSPIVGVTHTLSFASGASVALMAQFSPLRQFDALVCTSTAGRIVLQKVFEHIADLVESRTGVRPAVNYRLPVIPLGTFVPSEPGLDRAGARLKMGLSDDAVIYLFLGRFSRTSKMDPFPLVLTFCREILPKCPDALLVLAGDDTEERLCERLAAFAAGLGGGDRIRVLPNLRSDEKDLAYRAADVFVTLSDSVQETFGLTVLEAMARGLPVIASDWNGYKDTVEHGVTGFLVQTCSIASFGPVSDLAPILGDFEALRELAQTVAVDIPAFVAAVEETYRSAELRRRMGEAGRRRVADNFEWSKVIARYEDLWAELLAEATANTQPDATSISPWYRYEKVFAHYPTTTLKESDLLSLTATGRAFANGEISIPSFEEFDATSDPSVKTLLRICEPSEYTTVAALLDQVTRASMTRGAAIVHLIRLIKYGLLTIVAGTPSGYLQAIA